MKTFLLKGKPGIGDIPFSINDLIPVAEQQAYNFFQLVKLVDNSQYYSDSSFNDADYIELYKKPGHIGKNLFTIRDTGIVVIPGNQAVYPTSLTDNSTIRHENH